MSERQAGGAEGLAREVCPCMDDPNGTHVPDLNAECAWAAALCRAILTSDWLADRLAQAKAEALREAADALDERWYQKEAAMPDSHETSCWLDGHESAEEFIRDRADRIAGTR